MSDDLFRNLRVAGAGPRTVEAVRRALKLLAPPYPEPEVTAAGLANEIRAANKMLAACLAKRGKGETATPRKARGESHEHHTQNHLHKKKN